MRFTGVGVTCFAIDYGIMVILLKVFHVPELYATGISFSIATVINYFLSSRFVYDHKKKGKLDGLIFFILSCAGLGLNQLLTLYFFGHLGITMYITKIITGILVSFYNFTTRKLFLERHARAERKARKAAQKDKKRDAK